jgi:hypothetical protein
MSKDRVKIGRRGRKEKKRKEKKRKEKRSLFFLLVTSNGYFKQIGSAGQGDGRTELLYGVEPAGGRLVSVTGLRNWARGVTSLPFALWPV